NRYFYGGELRTGCQGRDSVLAPYTILNYAYPETSERGSLSNAGECQLAVEVAETVQQLTRANPVSIGIITFYNKQKANISLEIQTRRIHGVDVNTVDGYQGSERDVIIISCVRSGGESIGFLSDKERVNVALTRAKQALILIGDLDTLKKNEMWGGMISNGRSRRVVYNLDQNPKPSLQDILKSGR
ncbi:putative regulator of nonsense transcripts 1, partial [Eurytemora carolleeae]|uniref:putative regulator of nonsense transcripts 1 n=1 Tax=Eurytemora carolleeae TaxID=1294199 RepID=UPI000C77B63B